MGYEAVFLSLQETFPQVDSRVLRAVAFEHSKDVDAAAEFVLSEVLTSIRGPSEVIGPSREQDDAFGNQRTETMYTSHHSKPNVIACEIDLCATPDLSGGVVDVPCNSYVCASAEQCPLTPQFTGEVVEVSCTSYVDGSEMQCPIMPHQEVENQPFEPKPVDPKASDCINNAFHLNTCYLDKMVAIPYATSLDQLNAEPEASSQIEGTVDTFGELEEHCSNDLCAAVQDLNTSQQEQTHSVSCPDSCNNSSKVLENYEGEMTCEVEKGKYINRSFSACEEQVRGDASTFSTATCAHDTSLSVHDVSNVSLPFRPVVRRRVNSSEQLAVSCPDSCNNSSKVLENYEGEMTCEVEEGKYINRSFSACEEQVLGDTSTFSTATCAHDTSLSVHDVSNVSLPFRPVVRRRVNSSEQLDYGTELVCLDENDLPVTLATRSGHVVNIDLLEDFVTNARSNKQTLVSSMETVISMVQESEVLEARAKQAKEEASRAGQATLTKVEELKQILKHAKQANDMHAGDIYGEKAILSTEARELQSRLLSLSDEKERSFSIIKEIRQTLEERLVASQDEIAAAGQEKLEMEGLAQKALKEQELIMEMVVEKSKQLQQEAEENAKLREFLMDRGQVVDTLQGELAVVFEDVMLLKERVEGRLPLSRSLLRAYSSSLSSTSSSQRSICLSNNVLDGLDLGESPRANRDDRASMQNQDDDFLSNGEEVHATENHKVSEDEDWELCNDEA